MLKLKRFITNIIFFVILLLISLSSNSLDNISPENIDDILVVDCLLPGQIKRLGRISIFVSARRPIKTTVNDCGIRGGEYVSYDRSNYQAATKIWLSKAIKGDAQAQNYLGEIYEKKLGTEPNYHLAVQCYERAAEQGLVITL